MKIFLIVVLILFLIFAMILMSSVHVYVFFKDELKFRVRFWFYTYKSENTKDKPKKKKISKRSKKVKRKGKPEEKKSLSQKISEGKGLWGIASDLLPRLFRMIKIRCFRLYISVASEEAATTAINYGRLCAAVYPLVSVTLRNNFQKTPDVRIAPDFEKQKSRVLFETKLRINIGRTFWHACVALVSYLKLMRKFKQKKECD